MASAQDRAIEARRTQVARLMHLKLSANQVATQLGSSRATVARDMQAIRAEWLADRHRETAAHVAEELDLLARLQAAVLPAALAPDPALPSVDRVLIISDRRARLLGLDAPTKQQTQQNGDMTVRYVIEYTNDWRTSGADPDADAPSGTADRP